MTLQITLSLLAKLTLELSLFGLSFFALLRGLARDSFTEQILSRLDRGLSQLVEFFLLRAACCVDHINTRDGVEFAVFEFRRCEIYRTVMGWLCVLGRLQQGRDLPLAGKALRR